jgi:endoglucanase
MLDPHRLVLFAAATAATALLAAGTAIADSPDPLGGFQFSQPAYLVHENVGQATITITRPAAEAEFPAEVRYITLGNGYDPSTNAPFDCGGIPCSAVDQTDFNSVKGLLNFAPGETQASFQVPIVDHQQDTTAKTIRLAMFGPFGDDPSTGVKIGLGAQSSAVLGVLEDDPTPARNAANPLELPVTPPAGNPLGGARFFVDPTSKPAQAAKLPGFSAISEIAQQPYTNRFGTFSYSSPYVHDIGTAVSRLMTRAQATAPGTIPLLATYRIVDGHCGNYTPTASDVQSYHDFMQGFAQGIGSYPAVLFLEQDSLITSGCLSTQGVSVRMQELSDALDLLSQYAPHTVVYLDAGAADALPASRAAQLLAMAGVGKAQGFFLNSTHFDWTLNEIRYGQQISSILATTYHLPGKHFVVNTGENGTGPVIPANRVKQGNEVLCNPEPAGLGPLPTTNTGYPDADAFEWTSDPGESGGPCLPGAPATGNYWPQYALMLIQHANFNVTGGPGTSTTTPTSTHPSGTPSARGHKKQAHKKRAHKRRAHR